MANGGSSTRQGIAALIVVGAMGLIGLLGVLAAPQTVPATKVGGISNCPQLGQTIESRPDWRTFDPSQVTESARQLTIDPSISSAGVLWNAQTLVAKSNVAAFGTVRSAGKLRFHTSSGAVPSGASQTGDAMEFRRYVPVLFEPSEIVYSRQDGDACGYVTFLWVPAGPSDEVGGKHLTIEDVVNKATTGIAFLSTADTASIQASGLPVFLYIESIARALSREQQTKVLPARLMYFYHGDQSGRFTNRETGEAVSMGDVRSIAADFARVYPSGGN